MDKQKKAPSAPGLEWRNGKPRWRATKGAVAKGYRPKNLPLPADADEARLKQLCERYNGEMNMWLSGRTKIAPRFHGTFKSLFAIYQIDEESSFHNLKPTTLYSYNFYLPMLTEEIGDRKIERCTGIDVKRWFKAWSEPAR
jgi:hypothetical protein